jgi:hypothetical protein
MSYILAPTQVLWLGGVFTKSGPFAMNGLLGYWIPLGAWGTYCVVLSVAMHRALGRSWDLVEDPAFRAMPSSGGVSRRAPVVDVSASPARPTLRSARRGHKA